jgi:branched-chain amino acid transport system substrate-binding protein
VVTTAPYEVGIPTVDSQVVAIKSSAPDILITVSTPKYAAQVIRKLGELNWRPIHILTNVSVSIGAVLRPAGLQNSEGIVSAGYQMDVTDAQWTNYPGMKSFRAFLDRYYPDVDRTESGPVDCV